MLSFADRGSEAADFLEEDILERQLSLLHIAFSVQTIESTLWRHKDLDATGMSKLVLNTVRVGGVAQW